MNSHMQKDTEGEGDAQLTEIIINMFMLQPLPIPLAVHGYIRYDVRVLKDIGRGISKTKEKTKQHKTKTEERKLINLIMGLLY